ncbi:MAG: hypothetical protein A2138_17935 [Deltaproteobacteria bacterium RBG_16_71_12]|nr:MAG: hypothetical protein A2138_17935 [Deltaproteobacteria bacterium RBG_16_71_12]
MQRLALAAVVGAFLLGAAGCGPVISTYLIVAAQADLDGARAAESEKYAVYETTAASEYLHKAKEELGYADFGPAVDYAYRAQDMAQKARAKAEDEKKRQLEQPGAAWEAPTESGEQPKVIIKKKGEGEPGKVRVVPIPIEEGPR